MRRMFAVIALAALTPWCALAQEAADPFQWLEDVEGQQQMAWVMEQNARSEKELKAVPEYAPTYARALEIMDSKDRIAYPDLLGAVVYNFWQDPEHERGIWRRAPVASYRAGNPAWETVLDIDALNKAEGKQWVFKGGECLPPAYARCLVSLSRGGGDAVEIREFDTATKAFVPDGFFVPEAKNSVSWRDVDTLWLGTDFGPGSLTTSGYPRIVKSWRRGTLLAEATHGVRGQSRGHDGCRQHDLHPREELRPRRARARVLPGGDVPRARRPAGQGRRTGRRGDPRGLQGPPAGVAALRLGGGRVHVPRGLAAQHRGSTTSSRASARSRSCSSRRRACRWPASRPRATASS